ncbi:MAG: TerC/Alx family metal homeostasis membrane protein [Bacteroidota bacterium]
MESEFFFWIVFAVVFIVVFAIDMYGIDHRSGKIKIKSALIWSSVWVSISIAFGIFIYFYLQDGDVKALEFAASYLVEYSLSVDNLFVFIMIFSVMGIEEKFQPRILMWGIIGAVIMRILFIVVGVHLLQRFHIVIYLFGLVLVYTAIRMLFRKDEKVDPVNNIFVKLASRIFPVRHEPMKDHFFIKENGKLHATVAFITLVLIESTDLIFAVDSIPAVLAITSDPFIAITSNLFAILGLRSLYFALSGILGLFRYLKTGIAFILMFIGIKMLISGILYIPIQVSLLVIILSIAVSIAASVWIKKKDNAGKNTGIKP